MSSSKIVVDFVALESAKEHLKELIEDNLNTFFNKPSRGKQTGKIPQEVLSYFSKALGLNAQQREKVRQEPALYYAILVALLPHIDAHFFDNIIQSYFGKAVEFPQIGGTRGTRRIFIPTLETLLFVCQAHQLERRIAIQRLFESEQLQELKNVIYLEKNWVEEPANMARLLLRKRAVERLTLGEQLPPEFSSSFPAKRVSTSLVFDDLILNENTKGQVAEIENWIKFGKGLHQDATFGKHLKRGYRALFYGPSGTGKTITAGVLGKRNDKPVYVIDLSLVVSKYIGETEKNLANLLAEAEHQNWILFFDEADALFGKRSAVKDAHDRFANQEIAYLLQRIEDFDGLIIMATNMKNNIDEAFLRRFQSIISFPLPSAVERRQLWKCILPSTIPLEATVDTDELAKKYRLSGASIVNVVHYACLQAKQRSESDAKQALVLKTTDLMIGLKRELVKEGRSI